MNRKHLLIGLACMALLSTACSYTFTIPGQNTLFVKGEGFVLRGTATILDRGGPCLVWVGENGVTYHLFQGTGVTNEDYDRVATPGVTSRLQLATRSDLEVVCEVGTIVEVERVLEIVD